MINIFLDFTFKTVKLLNNIASANKPLTFIDMDNKSVLEIGLMFHDTARPKFLLLFDFHSETRFTSNLLIYIFTLSLQPTFMHVVAVGLEEGQPGVGFNTNGKIKTWLYISLREIIAKRIWATRERALLFQELLGFL